MAKKKVTESPNKLWDQIWFKIIGACAGVASAVWVNAYSIYNDRVVDLKENHKVNLEKQLKECEQDNENRLLQLKLDIQSEYFIEPSPDSPTAKKMEKVFTRIDKTKRK